MEVPDDRGAGGRAPRGGRGAMPGKIMGFVASPLQLISKTVKSFTSMSPSPNGGINRAGAAAPRPSPPPQQQQSRPAGVQTQNVEVAKNGFSFPTLGAASDSPPTDSLSRPAPVAPVPQPQRLGQPGDAAARAAPQMGLARDLLSGWSPSKLASLTYFMNGAKSGADDVRPTVPVSNPAPAVTIEPPRPYFNLTSMLRAGPGGLVSIRAGGAAGGPVASGSSGGAGGSIAASQRYNPYGRPNVSKPPRPGTAMLPPSVSQPSTAAVAGTLNIASHSQPAEEPQPSLAVATARLPPPNPRVAPPPSGKAPRAPTAPGAVRLAPGQVAFSSGRTGTPLPKFGPMAAAGQGQQLPSAHTPGSFRPLAGAAGGKRQRDSPAASPLMASGIRNLSEFKRRRQGSSQQPRAVLSGVTSRTPRDKTPVQSDGERTPGGIGSGGSGAAATPGPVPGSVVGGEVPATETARKILETLDNFKRTGDTTPSLTAGKSGAPPGSRTGPPTGSPFPGPFMPPLDRLDQNHYGGTPTPSVTTGAPGFAFGATPSPLAQTPGPRMVLEFQSPLALQRQPDSNTGASTPLTDLGAGTLPLSPISVTPSAAAAADRVANAGAALGLASATGAEIRNRADVSSAPGSSAVAAGAAAAPESTSASPVPKFSFSLPSVPSDPQLRLAKDICGANAASPSSSGSRAFAFGAATTAADAAAASASPSSARAGSHVAHEVAQAAAVPLPDDDEDEAEEAGAAAVTPATTLPPALDAGLQGQTSKPASSGGAKRVAFAEQTEPGQAEKQKHVDVPAKDAATATAGTPPATPGGFFFSSNAGSTPFRPFGAVATPATVAGDKTPGVGGKDDASGLATPSAGVALAVSTAAPAEAAKPVGFSFGQAAAAPSLTFGAPPKELAVALAAESGKADAAPEGDHAPADKAPTATEMSAPSSHFNLNPGSAVPSASPSVAAPVFGQTTFGAPAASVSAPSFTFGAAASAPSFGALTTVSASAAAPSNTESTAQPTVVSFGAASQSLGSGATPATSSAPTSLTPAFGSASANALATAPVSGFAPAASSAPALSAAAPAGAPVAATPSFTFGGVSATPGAAAPPVSFGSPMPLQNSSSAPTFGSAQPAAAAGGFGAGGFGASSGPATGFTFGAQGASGSSGGAATGSVGGFGAQPASSAPASTFSFGVNASAPSFGASAPAPSFGAAPAQQPAFGTGAPSFGAAAPANPFAAAAPSFAAPSTQPAFGAAMAGSTPAFGATAAPAAPTPSFGGFGASNGVAAAPAGGMFTFGSAPAAPFGSTQPAPAAAPTFGQAAPSFGQPPQPQAPAFGAAPSGFGAPGGFSAPPAFGGAQPAAPAGDAGGGFSLGLGDPKDGRKRVKARRHGH